MPVLVSGLSLLAGYYRIPHLDELSGSLLALDVYSCRRRSGWLTASVGLYAAALLFKEMALSLMFAAPLPAWYLSEPLFRSIGAEVYWVIVAAVLAAVHLPILHISGPHCLYWPAAFWGALNASLMALGCEQARALRAAAWQQTTEEEK